MEILIVLWQSYALIKSEQVIKKQILFQSTESEYLLKMQLEFLKHGTSVYL